MSFAHTVRDIVPIEDVIGARVPLKRSGNSWKGKCPFHADQKPSFYVSPFKKIYRCFSCGKGGDVINFLSEYENITFFQSITYLSKQYSITLPQNYGGDTKSKDKRYEIFKKLYTIAKSEYQKCLFSLAGDKARAYLESRGFSTSSCKKFELGFSPNNYRFLWDILQKMGILQKVEREVLLQSGLFILSKNGDVFDFFRDRIMFPIKDMLGESTLGFGARIIHEQSESPKYLNSPETLIFQKREILYGASYAREISRSQKRIFLVEGYTDAIACLEKNIPAVAPLGTSVTENQIRQVSRFAEVIYLVFDGDTPGENAGYRAATLSVQIGVPSILVLLPQGEDPQSFLQKKSLLQFDDFLKKNGHDVYDFVIRYEFQNQSETIPLSIRTEKAVKNLRSIASKISNTDLQKIFWRQVCDAYGSFSLQGEQLSKVFIKLPSTKIVKKKHIPFKKCEGRLFLFLCVYPQYIRESFSLIQLKYLEHLNPRAQKLFQSIFSLSAAKDFDFHDVVNFFKDTNPEIEKIILEEIVKREQDSSEQIAHEFWDLMCSFLKNHNSFQIQSAAKKLKEQGGSSKEILESILTLTKERENLHSYLSGESSKDRQDI